MSRASAQLLRPLALALAQRGISAEHWLAGSGLTAGELEMPGRQLPEEQVRALWQRGVALSGEADLGLRVGRSTDPQALGLLGLVLTNAKTIGQAFALLDRFHRLVYEAAPFDLEARSAERRVLHLHRDTRADRESPRPLVEYLLSAILRLAGVLAGGESRGAAYLRAVQFRHREPPATVLATYRDTFHGVPLRFECEDSAVHFDAQLFSLPVAYADAGMLALLQQRADQELRALATEEDIGSRAQASIRRRLAGAAPTVAQVAADCNMSRATLQRRLAAAGTGFQRLLNSARYVAAQELLADGRNSIEQIAALLGYADVSAFHHAFRRWSGVTPAVFRAKL